MADPSSQHRISPPGLILKYFFWKYLRHVLMICPYFLLDAMASVMSRIQMRLLKGRRLVTEHELMKSGLALPDNIRKITLDTFKNQFMSWLKIGFVSKVNTSNVSKYLILEGEDNLKYALSRGKGAILLNPHFGPFLFILPALGYRGYPVNQVAVQGEPVTGKREGLAKMVYEAQFQAVEGNMPARFINAAGDKMVMRKVLKALDDNQTVVFSPTGREGKTWHETVLFGRKATFNLVPFKTAVKTGSMLLPAFVLDDDPLARVIIEKPIQGENPESAEELLEQYVNVLARYAKNYPEHIGFFLADMHIKSFTDIKPFFSDYPDRPEPADMKQLERK